MSKRFFKGIVSAVLALSMILPMGGFTANAETNNSVDEILQETIQARAEQLYEESLKNQASKMEAGKLDQAAEQGNVRVIVEFKTTPNRVSMHKTGTSTLSKIKSEQSAFMKKALLMKEPPVVANRRLRVYYATQIGIKPPTFVLFVNDDSLLHFSYMRYLENQLRASFDFEGTGIKMEYRERKDR